MAINTNKIATPIPPAASSDKEISFPSAAPASKIKAIGDKIITLRQS